MENIYAPEWVISKEGFYDLVLPEIVTVQLLFTTSTNIIHDFVEKKEENKKLKLLMDASHVKDITVDIIKAFNRSMSETPDIKIATYSESKEFSDVEKIYLEENKNTSNNLDFNTREEAIKWLLEQ